MFRSFSKLRKSYVLLVLLSCYTAKILLVMLLIKKVVSLFIWLNIQKKVPYVFVELKGTPVV